MSTEKILIAVKLAFNEMLTTRGMFGIKPNDHWKNAIWRKDFEPLIRFHLARGVENRSVRIRALIADYEDEMGHFGWPPSDKAVTEDFLKKLTKLI